MCFLNQNIARPGHRLSQPAHANLHRRALAALVNAEVFVSNLPTGTYSMSALTQRRSFRYSAVSALLFARLEAKLAFRFHRHQHYPSRCAFISETHC